MFNIGGSTTITLQDASDVCEQVTGQRAKLAIQPVEKGDVRQTLADVSLPDSTWAISRRWACGRAKKPT